MASDRITPSERQLNLTFALLQSRTGLTKQEILATVPGYGYNTRPTESDFTMFDRDKDDIRKTGVVISQAVQLGEEGDNRNFRYRISNQSFAWPKGFHPSSLQTRLLEMAAHCWQDLSLTEELKMAMTRVVALGDAPDRMAIAELVPSFRPLDASFGPLSDAIENTQVVVIQYRKPGATAIETRTVSPWRILNVEGQWLVQGWCLLREAPRNFLLQRIVDKKIRRNTDLDYVPPTAELLAEADADLERYRDSNVATIRVRPDTPAWSAFEMDFEEGDQKQLRFLDLELMANRLRRFGNQVSVLEPQALADSIAAGFRQVAQDHA